MKNNVMHGVLACKEEIKEFHGWFLGFIHGHGLWLLSLVSFCFVFYVVSINYNNKISKLYKL